MLYKECVNCGGFSDDGANLQKDKVTIHLCPDCCDISDEEKDKLFEKFKPVPTISEILTKANLSMAEFSRMFEIPVRTVQDWKYSNRKPPEWAVKMIVELLKLKFDIEV